MKILLADDDAFTLSIIASYLEGEGYDVVTVNNGWEALQKIEEEDEGFDMIVSDIFMPEVSGLMMGNLVKQFYYSKTPLLLISSNNTAAVRRAVDQCGADGFIPKPVSKTQLIDMVHQLEYKSRHNKPN